MKDGWHAHERSDGTIALASRTQGWCHGCEEVFNSDSAFELHLLTTYGPGCRHPSEVDKLIAKENSEGTRVWMRPGSPTFFEQES